METLMNERITELMLKAGQTIPGDKHIDADFCEKFAELIVLECAKIANAGIDPTESHLIGDDILEHFGVE